MAPISHTVLRLIQLERSGFHWPALSPSPSCALSSRSGERAVLVLTLLRSRRLVLSVGALWTAKRASVRSTGIFSVVLSNVTDNNYTINIVGTRMCIPTDIDRK